MKEYEIRFPSQKFGIGLILGLDGLAATEDVASISKEPSIDSPSHPWLSIGVNLTKVDAASTTVADVYIISGSPNNSNNTEYIFNYTIEAETTAGCRTEFTGTITRNVEHTLIPNGSFSTDPPAICEGSAIEQISYTYSSGADGVLDPKWYEVDELGNETLVAKPNGILVDKGTSSNPIVTISETQLDTKSRNDNCSKNSVLNDSGIGSDLSCVNILEYFSLNGNSFFANDNVSCLKTAFTLI